MIPRRSLFSLHGAAPIRDYVISPDAKRLSYIDMTPDNHGLWVKDLDDESGVRKVSGDLDGILPHHGWVSDDWLHVPYDTSGRLSISSLVANVSTGQTFHCHPVAREKGQCLVRTLTGSAGPTVMVADSSRSLVFCDYYLVNLRSGERSIRHVNALYEQVFFGSGLEPVIGVRRSENGGLAIDRLEESGDSEELSLGTELARVSPEDSKSFRVVGFDREHRALYCTSYAITAISPFGRGEDGQVGERANKAVFEVRATDGAVRELFRDSRADVHRVLLSPTESSVVAVAVVRDGLEWFPLAEDVRDDLEALEISAREVSGADSHFDIVSSAADGQKGVWLVQLNSSAFPGAAGLYRRSTKFLEILSETDRTGAEETEPSNRSPVVPSAMTGEGPAHSVRRPGRGKEVHDVTSRDGLALRTYLTLPGCSSSRPLPMVLQVHSGPGGVRDSLTYSPWHQLLADRGCAVLSVNFRGSGGFGADFEAAGHLEWGGKMNDDLCDAVDWAVDRGVADPNRVGIIGYSYGGYAALAALAFSPGVFQCAVALAPLIDLYALATNLSHHHEPYKEYLWRQMGDPRTESGKSLLRRKSPLNNIDSFASPVLYAMGERDEQSQVSRAGEFIDALRSKGTYVEHLRFFDEGHVLTRPENEIFFVSKSEQFLARYLGFVAEKPYEHPDPSKFEFTSRNAEN